MKQNPFANPSGPAAHCAVCGDSLRGDFTTCSNCLTAHHRDCWEYNGGCAFHACKPGLPAAALASARSAPRWARAVSGVCMLAFISAALAVFLPSQRADRAQTARVSISNRGATDHRVVYYGGPRSLVTYGNLGNTYARAGEYDLAIACYEKVVDIDPKFSYGYFNMANLYFRKGDDNRAISLYRKALAIDPAMTEAYCNLGVAYQRKGDYSLALAQFRKAVRLDAGMAGSYYSHLGEIAYERGERDLARDAFAQAVEADPALATPKNNLAYLYAEQGTKLDEAMKLVDEALADEPDNACFLDTKGWIFYKQGDYSRAEEFVERAHNRLPQDMEIRGHLVEVWSKLLR